MAIAHFLETGQAGVDARTAFDSLKMDARGGFTGTIADKHSFIEYALIEGYSAEETFKLLRVYQNNPKALELHGVTPAMRDLLCEMNDQYLDTAGPAVCLKDSAGRYNFFGTALIKGTPITDKQDSYVVTWTTTVRASNEREAAEKARAEQLKPDTEQLTYSVVNSRNGNKWGCIDLNDGE